MPQLLIEIFSEEIPARMQARAADDLARLVGDGLAKSGLSFDSSAAYATPRRLALVIDGLPAAQPDVAEERRGPRVGAPPQAIDGFLRANALTSLEQTEIRDTGKGEFHFAVIHRKGRPSAEVVGEVIADALAQFPWPKSMRWGLRPERWVRPLHGLICLFDGRVVPVGYAGIESGDVTHGHRFLAPEPFAVTDFADYAARLREAKVLLDPAERRRIIAAGAADLAAREGLTVKEDDALLHEVAGLVEWPVVLMGSIDQSFMDVPAEVLTTAMRTHQKYFSVLDADGRLAPRFVVVANMETADGGKQIVAGNERVLRARLSDAKFFWDTDRAKPLADRLPKLAERVFQAQLGTMLDKVERVKILARHLVAHVPGADEAKAVQAADLAKADLSTEMVGEFPELQGIMGRYYALGDGVDPAVAEAIAEHYSPLGPNDRCPSAPLSVCVALADKLDTLVGFFGIDEKPTGSKDPYALRRAALGVIRLIVENRLRLPLSAFFTLAHAQYRAKTLTISAEATADALMAFFADRLKVHLREQGVRHDLITAVFALGGEDDLVRLLARVDALADFLATPDGENLLTAYRRAANIVRIEEKKDKTSHSGAVDAAALQQDEERALFARLEQARSEFGPALADERFADAMASLSRLRQPIDAFFDHVTVNADDPGVRGNRLRLLSRIGATVDDVADFSKIEG